MRRAAAVAVLVAAVLLGLAAAGGRARTTAQEGTPAGDTAGHPLVGTWIISEDEGAPSITTFGADGTAVDVSADGASAGVWEATGPRAATLTLAGVFQEEGFEGSYYIRAEIKVDEAGDSFASPYSFTVVAADGTVLESGEGMARGARMTVPAADAVGTPLPGFPTWEPAAPEGASPEASPAREGTPGPGTPVGVPPVE